MVKNFLKLIIIMAMINTSCSAQKNLLEQNINTVSKEQPEDSVLKKLQSENDLVIAYAIENYAWVKSMDYHIIAQNNNSWKGYTYHLNLMQNNAGSPTVVSPIKVDNTACNAILNYLTENKAWEIKGDAGENFCTDGNKNCNINDAANSRLWIITKNGSINPSYYAPEFYEKCCPQKQRGLFLSIANKITSLFGNATE